VTSGAISFGGSALTGGGRRRLVRSLRRAERVQKLRALALIAPLLLFLLLTFVFPIGGMLLRSVEDPELPSVLPRTAAALRGWDGKGLPADAIVAVFAEDLAMARSAGTLSAVANRLNYDVNGFRTLVLRTARQLGPGPHSIESLAAIDPRWSDRATWSAVRNAAGPYTGFYLLAALDRRLDADGAVVRTSVDQAIFVDVFVRTFWISVVVTIASLVLAYPVAYLLATAPERVANLLMIVVLLPFWTAVLVRTTAWMVLLQREGLINGFLRGLGVTTEPLALIHNRTGVYIAMTYVLIPFMILPIYGVMKGISPVGVRAALSLGARPFAAFRRVYLPQTMPGVSAGCLLVFIMALGYYVTPALVGGADDQMISYLIAFYTNQTLNWGMAAALSLLLLVATLLLYGVYARLGGTASIGWR
jgi:putative spermidine/putrescine transport system permease protein